MKSVKFNFFFLLIVTVLTTNLVFPGFSSLSGTPNFAHQDSLTSAMDTPNPSKTSQPSDTVLTRVSDVDILSSEAAGKDLTDDLLLLLRNAIIRDTTSNRKRLNDEFYNREQYFSSYDRNFLGYGWQLRNTFRYRSVLDPPLDYEGTFGVLNIKGSFISASVFYKNTYDLDQIWIKLARPYVTQDTK